MGFTVFYRASHQICEDLKHSPEAPIFILLQKIGQLFLPMKIIMWVEGKFFSQLAKILKKKYQHN